MYQANLKELLQAGRLGKIHLGQAQDEFFEILGTADYAHSSLVSYGDIEFYFEDTFRRLKLINLNFLSFWQQKIPSGGKNLHLDPWVLKAGLDPEDLIKYLNQEAINFCDVEPVNFGTRQLSINKNTTVIFNNAIEEAGDHIGLCKLSVGE